MLLKRFLSKRIYLSPLISQAVIFAASVAFLFAALYVQPGPFFDTLRHLNQSGIWIYLMNWLPIYLCAVMLHMLTNSCALAVSVTGAVAGSLSVANYLKIQMRHSPLFPWDLALVGEVLGIARSFPASLISMLIILFIGMLAFIALSVFFVRDKPLAVKRRIGGAVFVILASILMYGQYADKELYARAYVHGSPYNQVNRFNSRGFLYSFTHVLVGTRIEVPPGYSRQEAAAFLADCENIIQPRQTPHVIVIMSEAFSDIALNPGLDFTGFTDPLANFKEIKTESLSGHVVVPNIGGGTADMEFDFLTGVNTRHYRGVPYTFNLINKPIESLASKLTRIGYSSVMIHPGPGWFYDRANAYPHMGFDRTIFLPEFEGARYAGGYISEEAAIDKVISVFEEHIAVSNAPLFEFCITIQNHGPYLDKFLAPGDPPLPKNFETALPLSDASLNVLYNYFHGLTDADRELRRLTDYLEARPEPVVLLYFGDHLPSLDHAIYSALIPLGEPGHVSGETRLYRTPYIIWRNSAADFIDLSANAPAAETISSQYLGAILLRVLGYTGLCAYFDYAAEISEYFPVVLETRYADADGVMHTDDPPEPLAFLRRLGHYRFFRD